MADDALFIRPAFITLPAINHCHEVRKEFVLYSIWDAAMHSTN